MATELPTDILLQIFGYLAVHDVLRIRQSCKTFYKVSLVRDLWLKVFYTNILIPNIPTPSLHQRPLENFTSQELERLTLRALQLHRNWISPSPTALGRQEIINPAGSLAISLNFFSSDDYCWLLVLLATRSQAGRVFTVQCWDVSAVHPVCIAQREIRTLKGFAVNKRTTGPTMLLALNCPHIEVLSVDRTANSPDEGFITVASFPKITERVHLLSGTTLLTHDLGGEYLRRIDETQSIIRLTTAFSGGQRERPLASIIDEELLVVVRPTVLEIYVLPKSMSQGREVLLQPIVKHKWQWKIDSVVLARQRGAGSDHRAPIGILIRFGSYYPWPINILHRYTLHPNKHYIHSDENLEEVLPYHIPPTFLETIASPLRLHSTTDMVLGQFGTAMWVDNHTEDYFGHGDRGQRIAGRFTNPDHDIDYIPAEAHQPQVTSATSVYEICEDDRWVQLALDEVEGKIALGSANGQITVLSYA